MLSNPLQAFAPACVAHNLLAVFCVPLISFSVKTGIVHLFTFYKVETGCIFCRLNVETLLAYFITEPSSKNNTTNTCFYCKRWKKPYYVTKHHNSKALLSLGSIIDSAITLSTY